MFWKWKPKSDRPRKGADSPLFEAPRERRGAYRVDPHPLSPVTITLAGQVLVVRNISASGLAVVAPGLAPKTRFLSKLQLPDQPGQQDVVIEVIRVSDGDMRHCRFVEQPSETEDKIHQYVLERSKELIRSGQG